jgi:hypothetical protein
MEMLFDTTGLGLDAAGAYLHANLPQGTKALHAITHKLIVVKPLIEICRSGG